MYLGGCIHSHEALTNETDVNQVCAIQIINRTSKCIHLDKIVVIKKDLRWKLTGKLPVFRLRTKTN